MKVSLFVVLLFFPFVMNAQNCIVEVSAIGNDTTRTNITEIGDSVNTSAKIHLIRHSQTLSIGVTGVIQDNGTDNLPSTTRIILRLVSGEPISIPANEEQLSSRIAFGKGIILKGSLNSNVLNVLKSDILSEILIGDESTTLATFKLSPQQSQNFISSISCITAQAAN